MHPTLNTNMQQYSSQWQANKTNKNMTGPSGNCQLFASMILNPAISKDQIRNFTIREDIKSDGFISNDSAVKNAFLSRFQMSQPEFYELSDCAKIWKENFLKMNNEGKDANYKILTRLLQNKKISDIALHRFLSDVDLNPDGGFLKASNKIIVASRPHNFLANYKIIWANKMPQAIDPTPALLPLGTPAQAPAKKAVKNGPIDDIIDDEMANQIDKLFENTISTARTPFANTDLVIFKDSYQGNMPLNGIKESDFKKTCLLFDNICKNKTCLNIHDGGIDPNFNSQVYEAIKMLLTRELGRKLINEVCRKNVKVDVYPGRKTEYSPHDMAVTLNSWVNEKTFKIETTPSGINRVRRKASPLHVGLAHELTHHLHYVNNKAMMNRNADAKPTLEKDYHNLEEQITITGFSKEPDFSDFKTEETLARVYDEFNERNFESAFTNSKNIFYPRFGHDAVCMLDGMDMRNKENVTEYLEILKRCNVPVDLQDFLIEARKKFQPTAKFTQAEFNKICKPHQEEINKAINDSKHEWHQQLQTAKEHKL